MFGQPGAAAEATRVRQMLNTLAQINRPTDGQEPDQFSSEELDQVQAGLQQALAGVAQLREQLTAG